jgi:hypothetical protein
MTAEREDHALLERHSDIVVRAWHDALQGIPASRIARYQGLTHHAVGKILAAPPPDIIAKDLRFVTGLSAAIVSQKGPGSLVPEDRKQPFAFIVLLAPVRLPKGAWRRGLMGVEREISSAGGGRVRLGTTWTPETIEMSVALRMVHVRRFPCWEICPTGVAPDDGRHEGRTGEGEPAIPTEADLPIGGERALIAS